MEAEYKEFKIIVINMCNDLKLNTNIIKIANISRET